ncbi:HAMP domain-containing sensor histidine kinase [Kutzneria viridogrisea]|uniref:histidine kinase n=1 Tax=Kutzneria viridogrisea TaxID=47990 RepID=A0ABR6BKR7_9PSEU|nr:two-component system OmpR family sensor kinase [Kutzneria viridogrisea]
MVRRPWTLRTRLLLALLGFTAVGLVLFGALSVVLLDRTLISRVDDQLRDTARKVTIADRPPPRPGTLPATDPRLPTDFRLYFFDAYGDYQAGLGQIRGEAAMPKLPKMDLASVRAEPAGPSTVRDMSADGPNWRLLVVAQQPNQFQREGGTAAIAVSLSATELTVGNLALIEIICGSVLLALLGFTATVVVRLGLRPLTKIEQTAQAIADGELDRRVADTDRRTETGRLGAALNVMLTRISAALREGEQSERRLRRFVADASHELRTPLTSIRGFAELYRRGGATQPADVDRLMSRIESESVRMGLLVEDLLLLARLDQERSLDLTEVDLLVVANDVVHDAKAASPDRRIVLEAPNGPVRVVGDEHRLRQVVLNLVANAVTHTPAEAPIRVSVRQERARPREDALAVAGGALPRTSRFAVLEVVDEGPGIPADQAALVFDRFYRADQARSRTNGGSGLGLAITAAILEAHSGRIELTSTPGGGTSFRVLLAPA